MTSSHHLQDLLEVRDALLREVARLELAILREKESGAGEAPPRWEPLPSGDALSWERALHEAKLSSPCQAKRRRL